MLLCGCGGGNSSSDVSVTVTPASAVMKLNTQQQFSASISGTSNASVAWNVNGAPGGSAAAGTITSAGLYTSPASVPAGGIVTVSAISLADVTASASASVAILPSFVTIPSAQQWTVSSGSYTFSAASRIVIDSASAPELTTTAKVFAADLQSLTGVSIQPVVGSPNAGDIGLSLLATPDTGLGSEGYSVNVAGTVSISANTDVGAFYGTRTLLQLLSQGSTIGFGTIRDWPNYPQRALMVDVGRKYFTIQWLEDHIRDLAYAKINILHLHLSDNQGFRIQSESHPEVNSATSPLYTKDQMNSLIQLAAQYHITIIPEIEFPAHAQAILAAHPELQLTNASGNTLDDTFDITLPGTYMLAGDLLDEYLAFFPGPYWHGAADEYLATSSFSAYPQFAAFAQTKIGPTATQYDTYLYFENWVDKKVTVAGKSTRMWNDPYNTLSLTGTAEGLNKDILLEMWDQTSAPQTAIDQGYSILNASFVPLYYDGGTYDYTEDLYENWAPNLQFGGTAGWSVKAQDPGLPGASFEIWCDPPAPDETTIDQNTWIPLREFAQNIWGAPTLVPSYTQFDSLASALGRAPGFGTAGGPVAMTSAESSEGHSGQLPLLSNDLQSRRPEKPAAPSSQVVHFDSEHSQ
jgi:hexosaminidase